MKESESVKEYYSQLINILNQMGLLEEEIFDHRIVGKKKFWFVCLKNKIMSLMQLSNIKISQSYFWSI